MWAWHVSQALHTRYHVLDTSASDGSALDMGDGKRWHVLCLHVNEDGLFLSLEYNGTIVQCMQRTPAVSATFGKEVIR